MNTPPPGPTVATDDDNLALLTALSKMCSAARKGLVDGDDLLQDAEGLCRKLVLHVMSLRHLCAGTPSLGRGRAHVDVSSINVVACAALESYLVLGHVFFASGSPAESEFRHSAWALGGLHERVALLTQSEAAQAQRLRDEERIEQYRSTLDVNPVFQGLTASQQAKLLAAGEWQGFCEWRELCLEAGLSRMWSEKFYRFLCGFSQSDSLAVLQIRLNRTKDEQLKLLATTMAMTTICLALAIQGLGSLFPNALDAVQTMEFEGRNDRSFTAPVLAELWIEMGARGASKSDPTD